MKAVFSLKLNSKQFINNLPWFYVVFGRANFAGFPFRKPKLKNLQKTANNNTSERFTSRVNLVQNLG